MPVVTLCVDCCYIILSLFHDVFNLIKRHVFLNGSNVSLKTVIVKPYNTKKFNLEPHLENI